MLGYCKFLSLRLIVGPSRGDPVQANESRDEDKPWYWRLDNLGVIAVATSLCCLWSFLPTRFITRLAVVKRYPVSSSPTAPGKTTEFLRMQHGGHLMSLTDKAPMRDLQLSDVAIKAIGRPGGLSLPKLSGATRGQRMTANQG